MEATHLGAWFSERTDHELVEAISILAKAPLYNPKGNWLDAAFTVAQKYPITVREPKSLGIPTWLYGHEPPTCFAEQIAKYGVIFTRGSAGTIREIFQDAAQNHYKSFGIASPMLFLGQDYWKRQKPIYSTLTQLAAGKEYASLIDISDSRTHIVNQIIAFDATLSTS